MVNFLDKLGLFFFASDGVDQEYIGKVKAAFARSEKFNRVFCILQQFLDQFLTCRTENTDFQLFFMQHDIDFALREGKWAILVQYLVPTLLLAPRLLLVGLGCLSAFIWPVWCYVFKFSGRYETSRPAHTLCSITFLLKYKQSVWVINSIMLSIQYFFALKVVVMYHYFMIHVLLPVFEVDYVVNMTHQISLGLLLENSTILWVHLLIIKLLNFRPCWHSLLHILCDGNALGHWVLIQIISRWRLVWCHTLIL